MAIKEEQIMKLKQLDRIEFRQRYDKIKAEDEGNSCLDFFWKMACVVGFMTIILAIFLATGNKETAKSLSISIITSLKIMIFAFVLLLCYDICVALLNKIKIKKLIGEYFIQEVKTKKGRGNK
jgi:hypothetical protein